MAENKNIGVIIKKYFPGLQDSVINKLSVLPDIYKFWNEKINLISRKDIGNITIHHILHSLAIAKFIRFKENTSIMDVGTGGGFPGVPLSIFFPECRFLLIDSTGKKIKALNEIVKECGLENVSTLQIRAEEQIEKFDFITGRAVMPVCDFYNLVRKNISRNGFNEKGNGVLYLGGNINEAELGLLKRKTEIHKIEKWFDESYFEGKILFYYS